MAIATSGFGNFSVVVGNANVVGEVARSERKRMEKSVARLAVVFACEVVGSMAVVAGSKFAVRRFNPRIDMPLHDMAVSTRLGIVGEIRSSLGVLKRKRADSDRSAKEQRDEGRQESDPTGPTFLRHSNSRFDKNVV